MTKLTKPADLKRLDPPDKTKKSHHKKQYPLHWEIRDFCILASKRFKDEKWHNNTIPTKVNGVYFLDWSDDYKNIRNFIDAHMLDEALAIYAKHHPETANWPVRFINIPPTKTSREVI